MTFHFISPGDMMPSSEAFCIIGNDFKNRSFMTHVKKTRGLIINDESHLKAGFSHLCFI